MSIQFTIAPRYKKPPVQETDQCQMVMLPRDGGGTCEGVEAALWPPTYLTGAAGSVFTGSS
jgi:hypothetical protein